MKRTVKFRWTLVGFVAFFLTLGGTNTHPKSPTSDLEIGFSSSFEWIEIPANYRGDDNWIQRRIGEEVEKTKFTPYAESIDIYDAWGKEKRLVDHLWTEKKNQLAEAYRTAVSTYSDAKLKQTTLEIQKIAKKAELDALERTLEGDDNTIKRHQQELEFLSRNYEAQLKEISYMVIAMGKKKVDRLTPQGDIKQEISNRMKFDAVEREGLWHVTSNSKLVDDVTLKSYLETEITAFAQVVASYSNDFSVTVDGGAEVIRYLVQAIEVFPFKENSPEDQENSNNRSSSPKVYFIESDNLDNIWKQENLGDEKLPVYHFLQRIVQQALQQNQRSDSYLSGSSNKFFNEKEELQQKINRLNNQKSDHAAELEKVKADYSKLDHKYKNYEVHTLNPLRENYENKERNYFDHCSHRILFVDRSNDGFAADNESQDQTFRRISSNTQSMISTEYRQGTVQANYVLIDQLSLSFSESVVNYEPQVCAFTILWLTTNSFGTKVSYSATVGYKLALNGLIQKNGNTLDEPILEDEVFLEDFTTDYELMVDEAIPEDEPAPESPIEEDVSFLSTTEDAYEILPDIPDDQFEIDIISGPLVGMQFVQIPAGDFMMGSPEDEEKRDDDETLHKVTISRPFYLMTTEVTQAMWNSVMGSNPAEFRGDNRPVELVSWNDCEKFIKRLNKIDPGKGYRLPTEAEWEYACRAGTQTRYNTGDDVSDLALAGWYYGNSGNKTHPVAEKAPNNWVLFDMHGNVWEWCFDWHGEFTNDPETNPYGPQFGNDRIFRGGAWNDYAYRARAANRGSRFPSGRYNSVGFRVAFSP